MKFCVVGGTGVIVNLAVFTAVLLLWLALTGHIHAASEVTHYVRILAVKKKTIGLPGAAAYVANAAGFVVSAGTNYYLNRHWTFRSTGEVRSEFAKFFTVSLGAYGGQLTVFYLLHTVSHVAPIPSQLIAIACMLPVNFVLNKLWSFRGAG